MNQSVDIIIIGGGAIGLSLAWRLQQDGASVAVFDRGKFLRSLSDAAPEGQATIAAAGMLAPFVGAAVRGSLLQLALHSFRLWPAFTRELSQLSGVDVPIEGKGVLRLASNNPASLNFDDPVLGHSENLQERHGFPFYQLTPEQVRELEPAVNENVSGAVFSPLERQVQPRRLLHALTTAAERAGCCFYNESPVEGFTSSGAEVLSVETASGSFRAGQFVLAGGAWTGLLGEMLNVKIPIRPVRGQMLALEAPRVISHALFAAGGCLIPQADGRVMVGSTEEDAGFRSCNTAGGIQKLLHFAIDLVPALSDKPLQSAWAGLRPAAADGLPLLGAAPGWRNLYIASGHFRKGILLTPITAEWMSNWILRQELAPGMEEFSPARFLL